MSSLLRKLAAAQRRAERESKRRKRELEQQKKQIEKMQEYQRALFEVQVFENQLEILSSIHKECGETWDWKSIQVSDPPIKPSRNNYLELEAQSELTTYKPSFFEKLLGKADSKREQLKLAIEEAKKADDIKYQEAIQNYDEEFQEWKTLNEIAVGILSDQGEAYIKAIKIINPFSEINQLGSSIEYKYEKDLIQAELHVNNKDVIPSDTKTIFKNGKLSVKKMPKTKYFDLYQDYVCGAVLRVAREIFVLLPINMIIVTAMGSLLNTKTGYIEDVPILSVALPRDTIESLNFDMLDPSDSMSNFVHNMRFSARSGFKKVERISPNELQTK